MSRKEKVDICAKSVLRQDGVPPFRSHACEVMTHTLNPDSSSSELSRLVLRDLGLTSHVLRIANSAMYNHSGRPILNVRHAITLLGWEAIRNLVSAVRYIEYFASCSPGVRELVMLSVLTASHGRQVAESIGYERPDEAYVCGLFRNLGEVLFACYQPEEYSQILVTMHEDRINDRAAALRVLGFGWDDLGRLVAEAWNMPPKVRLCLEPPDQVGGTADRSLVSIATYGHFLTEAIYRNGARFDEVHLRAVLNSSGQPALVAVRDLRRIVDTTVEDAKQMFGGMQITLDTLRMDRQVEKAKSLLSLAGDREGILNRAALEEALQVAKRSVVAEDVDLSAFIQTMLQAVYRAGFDRAIFGFVTGDSSRIRGRIGAGEEADDLLVRFDFPTAVFPLDDRFDDGTLVVQQFNAGSFALLPVIVEKKLAGCLYAELRRRMPGVEQLRPSLCRVRDLIATAIKKRVRGGRTG